jgi:hypothetical protein
VPAGFLAPLVPDDSHGGAIRRALIRHNDFRISIPPHRFSEEFQCRSLIPCLRDISLQNLAFMLNRAPQVVCFASDFDKNLIEMLAPPPHLAHRFRSPLADRPGEVGAKSINPETHTLVANVDPTLVQEVLDIAQ